MAAALSERPADLTPRNNRLPDGAGGLVERPLRFSVWFEPVANGKTPMNGAVEIAKEIVGGFPAIHSDCFPPLIDNLTDGQPADANPLAAATALNGLESSDGNVLMLNAHLSSSPAAPIAFPHSEDSLPDVFSKLLFRRSSLLPTAMAQSAQNEGYPIAGPARGFIFNADLVAVPRFREIGTRAASGVR